MKSREQRLIEVIEKDLKDNVYMGDEEAQLRELIEFLETNIIPNHWEENEFIIKAVNDFHELCIEFGV